jgi:hypothetical protein
MPATQRSDEMPFQKGQSGNPRGPRGARNKATILAETLLKGDVEAMTRLAVERAMAGDFVTLRLCLDSAKRRGKRSPPQRKAPP